MTALFVLFLVVVLKSRYTVNILVLSPPPAPHPLPSLLPLPSPVILFLAYPWWLYTTQLHQYNYMQRLPVCGKSLDQDGSLEFSIMHRSCTHWSISCDEACHRHHALDSVTLWVSNTGCVLRRCLVTVLASVRVVEEEVKCIKFSLPNHRSNVWMILTCVKKLGETEFVVIIWSRAIYFDQWWLVLWFAFSSFHVCLLMSELHHVSFVMTGVHQMSWFWGLMTSNVCFMF